MYHSDTSICFPPEEYINTAILLAIIIAEIDSCLLVTVCDFVAYLRDCSDWWVYPNNTDLTGTVQLDIAKQTKNMQNQNK